MRATEEGFALRTTVSQAAIGWDAYRDAWERSGFWYLRQISGASSFLPKRALDDAQQAELAEFFPSATSAQDPLVQPPPLAISHTTRSVKYGRHQYDWTRRASGDWYTHSLNPSTVLVRVRTQGEPQLVEVACLVVSIAY